jgi:hypothetical protein
MVAGALKGASCVYGKLNQDEAIVEGAHNATAQRAGTCPAARNAAAPMLGAIFLHLTWGTSAHEHDA